MKKLTIDTNVINAKSLIPAMNTLERWDIEGKIELVAAYCLERETSNYLSSSIKVKNMPNISEPCVAGLAVAGCAYAASEETLNTIDIALILFPHIKDINNLSGSEWNDVMYLMAHFSGGGDIFVTNDKHFIKDKPRAELKKKFGIIAMKPNEVVEKFSKEYGWEE